MIDFIKNLFRKKIGLGLLPLRKDGTEFELGALWGFGDYTPKKQSSGLNALSVKYQAYNTCQFNSAVGAKEIDEGVKLSTRFLVCMGRKLGLISGDGFSNIKTGDLILQKYGVCEYQFLPDTNELSWEEYSSFSVISPSMIANALKHKIQSYWFVRNYNQAVKALDKGHPVRFGVGWRTSMNMSGGFSVPWLLNFLLGYLVDGHAIYAFDWNLNYQGKKVLKCVNSYGTVYGDGGFMYITEDDFNREVAEYGATANLDIPRSQAEWLITNSGKIVKELNGNKIYFIGNGVKQMIPDMATFFAYNFKKDEILIDEENMLPNIPSGETFNFWNGSLVLPIYEIIKMAKDDTLKPIFKSYFDNLFI